MAKAIKVLIADDHPIFRQGLRQVIEQDPRFGVVDEAENGTRALEVLEKNETDVVVLDIQMPGLDGFDVVRRLQKTRSPVAVLLLTMHNEEDMFQEAMDLGVKGYVLKESAVTDVLQGIEAIARGRHFISPMISEYLFGRQARTDSLREQYPGLNSLTGAELRILKMIAQNMTSKEIAQALNLSVRTVDNHRARVCGKLNLHGIHSLVKFAFDNRSRL